MPLTERQKHLSAMVCFLACFCFPAYAFAETVSIMVFSNETEGVLVEAAMKRYLRAEGYTVKGGTTDGYLLLISVMPNTTVSGYKRGVIGHITVSSLSWQDLGDTLVSDRCKGEHELAQQFKEIVGTRMIFINSIIAQASNEDSLAEMLSTFANRQIRTTSKKVTEFLEEVRKQSSPEVSSPPIEQMR